MSVPSPSGEHFTSSGADDETVVVGHYVVLFLDVLNQREAIRRLEKLPKTDDERAAYIRALNSAW